MASGFMVARFDGEDGHVASSSATAIYFNPAGLTLRTGTHFFVEGLFAYRTATYERPAAAIDNVLATGERAAGTPAEAVTTNSGKASLAEPVAAPFVALVSDLGQRDLAVGLGLYAPFGGSANWDANEDYRGDEEYPGAVDGVQRWAIISGTLRSVYLTAAGSYALRRLGLHFGVSANLVLSDMFIALARNSDGSDNTTTDAGDLREGRSLLDVSDKTFSLGLGVMWEPSDEIRLGVSYQSQPGFGDRTFKGNLSNRFPPGESVTQKVIVESSLPDVLRLGASLAVTPELELHLSGDYVFWSRFERQCVMGIGVDVPAKCAIQDNGDLDPDRGGRLVIFNLLRDWKDAMSIRGGASFWLKPKLQLQGGLGYDQNAVPDATLDPGLMDMNKVIVSAGARYGMAALPIVLSATYTQVIYFDREVAASVDAMGNHVSRKEHPTRRPDFAGKYTQSIGLLTLNAEYTF
jgi:long-chain fatty acid transport protein